MDWLMQEAVMLHWNWSELTIRVMDAEAVEEPKNRDGHWHEGFRLGLNCWQTAGVLFSEQHAGPVAKHKTCIAFTKKKKKIKSKSM